MLLDVHWSPCQHCSVIYPWASKSFPFPKKKWFVQNVFQLCLVGSRHIFFILTFWGSCSVQRNRWQCLVSIGSLIFFLVRCVCPVWACAFVSKARGCSVTVWFSKMGIVTNSWEDLLCGYEIGHGSPSDGPRKGRECDTGQSKQGQRLIWSIQSLIHWWRKPPVLCV